MSLYCPKCWAKAKCIDSRCHALTNTVRRRHKCQDKDCGHRFTSIEIIVGEVDLGTESSKLSELAWQIYDLLK